MGVLLFIKYAPDVRLKSLWYGRVASGRAFEVEFGVVPAFDSVLPIPVIGTHATFRYVSGNSISCARKSRYQKSKICPGTSQAKSSDVILSLMTEKLAGIEYVGLAGISRECQDGVLRLLQYGTEITRVRILSTSKDHCLLLTVDVGDLVAVKSGFSSGYRGEGPRTFSYVLEVLEGHGVNIDEYIVPQEMIERLDMSSLTSADLKAIDAAKPVRPSRWHDYIFEPYSSKIQGRDLWRNFPLIIPFAIIDSRITDLAISFWEGPDERLLTGYRRLEDIFRERTSIDEHGTKLLSQALAPNGGKLTWKDIGDSERAGRMQLFTGAYQAYRNRRAHRESKERAENALIEFLLLNHLYILEKELIEVSSS
jgi:hypothetical protein